MKYEAELNPWRKQNLLDVRLDKKIHLSSDRRPWIFYPYNFIWTHEIISKSVLEDLWNFPFSKGKHSLGMPFCLYIFFNLIFLPSVLIPSSVPNSYPCFEKQSVSVILPNLRFRKQFRHRSVPVLCIFNYVRLRSVFRTLFWIFTRTRTFSVPVPLGTKTEKIRIRARRSGYGLNSDVANQI